MSGRLATGISLLGRVLSHHTMVLGLVLKFRRNRRQFFLEGVALTASGSVDVRLAGPDMELDFEERARV